MYIPLGVCITGIMMRVWQLSPVFILVAADSGDNHAIGMTMHYGREVPILGYKYIGPASAG